MHSTKKTKRNLNASARSLILVLLTMAVTSKAQTQQQITNKLILPDNTYTLKFSWQGDSINNSYEKHSALLIPVRLSGCPKTFYMQFDLGSPYSLFYQKKIQTIKNQYPKTTAMFSTSKTAAVDFKLSGEGITAKEISLRDFGTGTIDWDSKAPQIIGTIGVDLFDGKILVIDYPNQKLTISPELPKKYKRSLPLTPFTYAQRSILLPATIQGKKTMLFFDTGSSRYALLTDEKTAKTLSMPNAPTVTSKVRSWDRVLTANTLQTDAAIDIANQNLPLQYVTYMQGASSAQIDAMMKMGIGGMTGNKLFLKHKLILDTKNKKFGITLTRATPQWSE